MKLKLTVFVALLISSASISQEIPTKKIDSFINHIEVNNRGIGSISIFKNGKEIYNRSFGQEKLTNIEYDSNTKYQIGSITKMITATLIFEAIENNKLNLNDKLSKFYPEIPNSDKITIKNLLEHSSGLGDFTMRNKSEIWLTEKVEESAILSEIIEQGVSFEPNENVEYSNSGYFLLKNILEKISGKNYASIVKQKIAVPYDLDNFQSINDTAKNIFYSYNYSDKWYKIDDFDFSNVIGVGDIVSTTNNLNKFLFELFNYKILSKNSVNEMKPDYNNKENFGRGLMLIPFYDHLFFGHGGDTYGTHSLAGYNEKDSLGFSFAINGERFLHNDFAIGILSIIYNKEYEFPSFKTIDLKTEDLDKLVGVYSSANFPLKLTITRDGNSLKGRATGQPEFPLECYEVNKFKFDQANLRLEFIPVQDKLILNQGGMKVEMQKE